MKDLEFDQQLGRRVRALRIELELSQKDLADQLGISSQQVQKYEAGANRISAYILWQLKDIFQIEWDMFFTDHETTPSTLREQELKRQQYSIIQNFPRIASHELREALAATIAAAAWDDKREA